MLVYLNKQIISLFELQMKFKQFVILFFIWSNNSYSRKFHLLRVNVGNCDNNFKIERSQTLIIKLQKIAYVLINLVILVTEFSDETIYYFIRTIARLKYESMY